MTLLGFSHGAGHHSHSGGHGSRGHGNDNSMHGSHSASRGDAGAVHHLFWLLLSPRVLFSLALGFGATGCMLKNRVPALVVLVAAIAGAWIFERWIVQPVWRLLLSFASTPARTLDNSLLDKAQAACNFDAEGHGLVAVEIDGQVRQLLGTLRAEERKYGVRVRTGDDLIIVAINTRQNSCTVARLR
jgi:hypothetical protein